MLCQRKFRNKKGSLLYEKTISRLPDSELDIMLVLWNHELPMGRLRSSGW